MSQETIEFAYLAIGSNVEPRKNVGACIALLRSQFEILSVSSQYITTPWGLTGQPDFLNLVVRLATSLSPRALLTETANVEAALGRHRTITNGPRTIDIDILLFGELIVDEEDLTIPHRGLLLRDFMLVPLVEIAPEAIHPRLGRPVSELGDLVRYRHIVRREMLDV